ncbi:MULTISPECIES: acyl-CoA dehydrogenase family protein [Brucella/Ochrobactrum group]|uniref:Medium-chain specific acyl-CoA dehydrogenase, mitochondrial n=6 Tax=Brucella/Ochrobactrum group TaxID=2826938 RepID=A0A256GYS3_9HYPH|nr:MULTISPECIES: acyl-CoA dehydrogenase family protein [Brucella/Ochrobactrum group]MCI0999435.1 acyl-CoA/acyl-ACP dehydrogenase [Ochrobactrum sp. C6C9]MCR5943695.1 acyl-CoA dehydrogenase [Ochrobactrum sp. XJ1]RRD21659.1 acyl-CoA dehydrogenase [Brucellaceae bacterium VT-16-1752]WHT45153.1 acyl-CoA dehydrogenase family protein [Ochrobactrum sp. SSR]AEK55998.1 acyl-CoA dehydrogenase protein [Brucella pinnipedialis B2/94]
MDFALSFEQQALIDSLEEFCKRELYPHENLVEELRYVPEEIKQEIQQKSIQAGFAGMNLPEEWGGPGLDKQTKMQAERVLGKSSAALTMCMNRGVTGILFKCKGDQIEKYLKPAIRGERKDAFALTEPGAGSDARGITTKAVRDGDHWVINGVKQFISHADIADFIVLIAVTGVDETPRGPRKRFTAFLLDKTLPGLRVEPMKSIVTRGYNPTMVYLEDVRVHSDDILGEEGKGFDTANEWLYDGRVALAAHCVGRSERIFEMTKEWAGTRKAFGKTIGEFQGVGFKVANMAVDIKLGDLMVKEAAWKIENQTMNRTEASMVNYWCSEMVFRVADDAVQIFGGMGVMEEFPIQRFWRDARIERIWEGTSEVHQDIIAKDLLRPYQ